MSDNIKLVIEIPKDIYARCKEYKLWSYDAETLEGAVATSKPLSEVLDEIKAEIKEHRDNWEKDGYLDEADALNVALKHINKHIAGEYNEYCSECECKEECDGIEYMSKDQCEKKRGWQ